MKKQFSALLLAACLLFGRAFAEAPGLSGWTVEQLREAEQIILSLIREKEASAASDRVPLEEGDRVSAGDGENETLSRNICFIPDGSFTNADGTCHADISDSVLHIHTDSAPASKQYVEIASLLWEENRIVLTAGMPYTFSMLIDRFGGDDPQNGGSYCWKAAPTGGGEEFSIGGKQFFTNSANTIRTFTYTPEEDVFIWLQLCFSEDNVNDFYAKLQVEQGGARSDWVKPVDPASLSSRLMGYIDAHAYRLIQENRTEIAQRVVNRLCGKTVLVFGDSIARGSGEGNDGGPTRIVAARNGMRHYNLAKGGSTIHLGKENNILAQIEAEHAAHPDLKPDFIVFDGGANDAIDLYTGRLQLGEFSNEARPSDVPLSYEYVFDDSTFTGALEKTACKLHVYYPESIIIYFFPHQMTSRDWNAQNQIHDRAVEVMKKWGVAMVDLFDCGLNTYIPELKKLYTSDSYGTGLGDGTHPNLLGYKMFYAPQLEDMMRRLAPILDETDE